MQNAEGPSAQQHKVSQAYFAGTVLCFTSPADLELKLSSSSICSKETLIFVVFKTQLLSRRTSKWSVNGGIHQQMVVHMLGMCKKWWKGPQQPMQFTYSNWIKDEKNLTDML